MSGWRKHCVFGVLYVADAMLAAFVPYWLVTGVFGALLTATVFLYLPDIKLASVRIQSWWLTQRRGTARGIEAQLDEILDALKNRDKRDEAAVYSLQEIKEAVESLPQHRFEGTNHTYAELPAGTNIVTMEDGSIRLAIPKQIAATFTAPPSTASVALSKRPPNGS